MTRAIIAIAAFIGGAIGLPLIGFAVSPALKEKESAWVEIGPASKFRSNEPEKVNFVVFRKDGWIEEPSARSCWVVKKSDSEFVIFDPRCTHLGCPYSWHADKDRFLCPCHLGVFDLEGNVVSGPPPRPLRRFASKVEGGKLYVREVVVNA